MRILLVGAGSTYSTKDVELGYLAALRQTDADVFFYNLGARIKLVKDWLHVLWRARGKHPEQRPGWPEVIYRASVEAFEMAVRFNVDWVFVVSGQAFHGDVIEMMRRVGVRTAVLFTESPYEDDRQEQMARNATICWTTERTSVHTLRQAGANVHYIRHAFDRARHQPDVPLDLSLPAHDVVFVGSGFAERIDILNSVDWSGINLGLYGEWKLLGSKSKLRQFVRAGPVSNETAVGLYRRAKIGLNLYRTSKSYGRRSEHIAYAESMNPRAYELAACGLFQISDFRLELDETLGDSVPTFGGFGARPLEDILRAYLQDSPARRYAARRAHQAIQPHTFAARAAQVLADLESFEAEPYPALVGTPVYAGLKGA
jgi:spore maturation protein CgeB